MWGFFIILNLFLYCVEISIHIFININSYLHLTLTYQIIYSIKNNIYEKRCNVNFVYCFVLEVERLLNISLIYVFGIELETDFFIY